MEQDTLRRQGCSQRVAHQAAPLPGFANSEQAGKAGSLAEPESIAAPAANPVLFEEYRRLVGLHVQSLPSLFKSFTGLSCHIAWAPASPRGWDTLGLPTKSPLCRQSVDGKRHVLAQCRTCITRHLALALNSSRAGHKFTCSIGLQNFWLPIIIRGCVIALALIQALALPASGALRRAASPAAPRVRTQGRMGRNEFDKAAELLQLVFRHIETSALADLRKTDLTRAQRALLEMQTVTTRLRSELNGLVPAINKSSPVLEPESHTQRTVRAALEFIHQHYSQPLTLQECAKGLRLNAAYLSALFSRAAGLPFKTYLTELRVEKARELLSDPTVVIADVACAVGYASENRFRLAFKQVTGLSPRAWRDTLRMQPRKTAEI